MRGHAARVLFSMSCCPGRAGREAGGGARPALLAHRERFAFQRPVGYPEMPYPRWPQATEGQNEMATTANRRNTAVKEAMTKAQLLEALSESTGLQRKDVASVLEQLGVVIERLRQETRGGNVHASPPAEDQGGAQARKKGAQDDVAVSPVRRSRWRRNPPRGR